MPEFRGAGSGGGYPYVYDASILRYFAAIAVGMWLAIDDARAPRRRLVVVALAVPSVAYIAAAGTDPSMFPSFVHGFTLVTNFAAVPWAAAMLLAALHLWPARSVPGSGWLERLGAASYEVFLVQVVWLGVLQDRGQVPFLVAAIASGLLGCALHRVLTASPSARSACAAAHSRAARPPSAPRNRRSSELPVPADWCSVPLAFREAAEGDESDQRDDEPDDEAPHDHQDDADDDEDAAESDAAGVAACPWFCHELPPRGVWN